MPLRILLVQSNMDTAQPLARYFTQRGDEVWQAWELGQAMVMIEQAKPSVLFMDLHYASGEWIKFVRRVRDLYPQVRIIMTNEYPDLQREMMAREQGIYVFLRQPFTARWIEQSIRRLEEDTQPVRSVPVSPVQIKKGANEPQFRPVRVPVRVKITLPYLMLALLFALASSYIVSRVVLESIRDRFLSQLVETARQSTDWMVREEDRLLGTQRLVANTTGVAEAVQRQDAESLRGLVLPLMVNAGEEAIEILDPGGTSVLSVRAEGEGGYGFTQGESIYREWEFVQQVSNRAVDAAGDKFAGAARAPWGDYFYVSGPILDPSGGLAGIVLVGRSLDSLTRDMRAQTYAEVTLYDPSGVPLASTLAFKQANAALPAASAESLFGQEGQSPSRDVQISAVGYTEVFTPWIIRGQENQGILGIALAQAFFINTSRVTQVEIFVLVAASILLVLLVGLYLANLITRPLLKLVTASGQVAQGNLEVKVDARGDDEIAVLAQSFNYMIAGLQEGSIYRDLLGRTVSPEVREQLRQTFTTGNLRLEGQQALATVLMSDIRGFTSISEQADPATVFQWLNEYFSQIVPIIAAHGGVVNKFDGDAMLAFFGILPRILSPKQSAVAACTAGLEMLQAIDRLNYQRARRGDPPLITGIGINTGPVSAGGLGTSDRLHYTIIGDTVNTTQRIEALTRSVMDCSGILIGQSTYTALGASASRYQMHAIGAHRLKGKTEPISLYELQPAQTKHRSGKP